MDKPKIIYTVLTILLIASFSFYLLKEKEKRLRIATQNQLAQAIEEKKEVENKLTETFKAKEQVEGELASEKVKSSTFKKLEAMEVALKQTQGIQGTLEVLDSKVTNKSLKHVALGQTEQGRAILAKSVKVKKNTMGIILWFIGLVSISGLGFALWRKYAVVRAKNLTERIRELKLQLEEKDKLLEQVEIIRKTIEKTAIEKEKEYAQLKLELQEKNMLFVQEEAMRKEKEKTLLELEKQHEQLRKTSESLKDVLIKRGIAKELTLPQSKEELWILGKSQDRRNSPRLSLTKDFHNTVILKIDPSTLLRVNGERSRTIELPNTLKQLKSFAENISSGGLCFETTKELDDKHPINLRLFFYGGRVPITKVQGRIVWKKIIESSNYYGLCFDGLGEKEKLGINSYIESKRGRS